MSEKLVRSREYLSQHRRTIIGRSLAAAIAGAVPVPVLDDWLMASIRRSTIRRIAESRGIDIDDEAVAAIADGPETPPNWSELVGGGLVLRIISKQWKKLVVAVLAARRAQAAVRNFEIATLFDHYCARVHRGFGLNAQSGKELRALMDEARAKTEGGLSRRLFRRGLLAAAKATVRAPVEMADTLSGGRLTRLLRGESEVEAVTEVDETLEMQLRGDKSYIARSATAIELELAVDRNPYLDNLIDTFDALCTARNEENEPKEGAAEETRPKEDEPDEEGQ